MRLRCLEGNKTPTEAFLSPFPSSWNWSSCLWSTGIMQSSRGPRAYHVTTTKRRRVLLSIEQNSDQGDEHPKREPEQEKEERRFKYRFDPHSDMDAFGRDPRKETEFWMDAAKNVLESDEVQKAIADHAAKGGDGLTNEQREYLEFIKSLDQESA